MSYVNKLVLMVLVSIGLTATTNGQMTVTPRVEIHHIGAGDGDATLFIIIDELVATGIGGNAILDTAIILVDGQRSGGGKEVWRYIRDTVNKLSPLLKKIDLIVVSHLHFDHFGGITTVLNQANNAKWTIGAVIDRQNANYSEYLQGPDIGCYGDLSPEQPSSKAYPKYLAALRINKSELIPTIAIVPGVDILSPFGFKHISMICMVANGQVFKPGTTDFVNFLPKSVVSGKTYYTPKSENDLSMGFLLEFQGFHYLTLGDLGGVNGGNYVDGETPVTNWLSTTYNSPNYHVCGLKVSHHGSAESTTASFVTANNPTVSVIEAALMTFGKSVNPLPTQVAITNLKGNVSNNLYYTFVPKDPSVASSYWKLKNLNLYNDVVLKVGGLQGVQQNVTMQLIQAQKSKDKFVYNGNVSVQDLTCTKGHQWSH